MNFMSMIKMPTLILSLFIGLPSLAIGSAQAQGAELELEITLVGENDSPDHIINTIALPDFSFTENVPQNTNNDTDNKLTGQERSEQAKSQAYGLIKEDKKDKVKKEKVKKDKNENSNNANNNSNGNNAGGNGNNGNGN